MTILVSTSFCILKNFNICNKSLWITELPYFLKNTHIYFFRKAKLQICNYKVQNWDGLKL